MYSDDFKAKFYRNSKTNKSPVLTYIECLKDKEQQKILKYIEVLREHRGYLDEPYSKHIKGKIRELRIDFFRNRHRILFVLLGKTIILLHAFTKKAAKTPLADIKKAEEHHLDVLNNKNLYE